MRTRRRLATRVAGAAVLAVLSGTGALALSVAAAASPTTAQAPTVVVPSPEPRGAERRSPAPPAAALPAAAPPAAAPQPPATRPASTCAGPGWQERRGRAAISRLRRPVDTAGAVVAFHPARQGVMGLTDLQARRVDVFVRSCARQSDDLLLHVLAHELGHVRDANRMTGELRAAWKRARGIPAGTPWFGCEHCSDFATPAGDYAETYAQWQRGARDSRSMLAPPASPAELEVLAARFF